MGVGPYSTSAISWRVTNVRCPSPAGRYGPRGSDLMNRPVKLWPVMSPLRIDSSTSSARGVLLYRVTVSSPRPSARGGSNGVPSGTDPRSDGVPCNVRAWL